MSLKQRKAEQTQITQMKQPHGKHMISQFEIMKTWSKGSIQARDWAVSMALGKGACPPWVGPLLPLEGQPDLCLSLL